MSPQIVRSRVLAFDAHGFRRGRPAQAIESELIAGGITAHARQRLQRIKWISDALRAGVGRPDAQQRKLIQLHDVDVVGQVSPLSVVSSVASAVTVTDSEAAPTCRGMSSRKNLRRRQGQIRVSVGLEPFTVTETE